MLAVDTHLIAILGISPKTLAITAPLTTEEAETLAAEDLRIVGEDRLTAVVTIRVVHLQTTKDMRIAILLLTVIACACSNDSVTTQQAGSCARTIEQGTGNVGQPVTIRAFLKGCKSVVFQVETRSNGALRRIPSACDLTQDTFTFASSGDTLYLGLFSCGDEFITGKYRMEVESKGQIQEYDAKIGYTLKYIIP